MSLGGIVPITEKFLQQNYLFAMAFSEGYVFGRVERRRICQYKPYYLIDKNGNAIDITEGSYESEGCLRFRDPRNSQIDVLYLDEITDSKGSPWFLHGAIGIKPQQVRMYYRFPEAKDIPGRFPNVDPISPTSGDNLGYVSGIQSPYENPSDFVELVIPPRIHICAEFYNMDSGDGVWNHRPCLNILFAVYWFQALSPQRHATLISKIARREVPAAFFSVGVGTDPIDYPSNYESEWGVTVLTLDEAAALSGGQGRLLS